MSSRIADLGDAIVASLNGGTFSQDFTAARKWIVKWSLAELSTLRVTVVPGPSKFELVDRGEDDQEHQVDIAVQKKIDPDTNTNVDELVEQVEEIIEHCRKLSLTAGSANVLCTKRETISPDLAVVDPQMLKDKRTFTGVIRTTWKVL